MTEEEIKLVKESWSHVLPIAEAAMTMFYDRLFAMDADVARLFAGKDMSAQRAHLAGAVDGVVRQLHRPEALMRPLQELGARHAGYGVAERDFDTVGDALLATLADGLADRWTPAHARAWSAAWGMIVAQVLTGFRAQKAA